MTMTIYILVVVLSRPPETPWSIQSVTSFPTYKECDNAKPSPSDYAKEGVGACWPVTVELQK